MSWRGTIFLLAGLLAGVPALRAADCDFNVGMVTGADADIRLTVPGGRSPQGGFLPVRVRIANRSPSERSWQIEVAGNPGMMGGGSGAQVRSTYSFTVPAAATHEFFIFVPLPATPGGRGMGISVQGQVQGPEVENSRFNLGLTYGWSTPIAPVAIEPALAVSLQKVLTTDASERFAAMTSRRSRFGSAPVYRGADVMERVSIIDPLEWPADPRLWSSFPLVMLEAPSWEKLDTGRRHALLDWVALGGRLILSPAISADQSRREMHGAGDIITLAAPLNLTEMAGLISVGLEDHGRLVNVQDSLADSAFWNLSPREWQLRGKHAWLTWFVVAFGLLIGPVNLFVFAPAGRRHRLFLTVPLISVSSSVALFVIITASDGFGGEGTRRAVVVLLPAQNQAAVFQKQISRTGLLSGREFALPADAQMERLADDQMTSGAGPVLWRKDDVASGDWFTSRTTQQHVLRRLVPTRERVELVSAPGAAPVVQSTVAATLRHFAYRDAALKFWTADEVPPGVRVTLKAEARQPAVSALSRYTPSNWPADTFYALGAAAGAEFIATLPAIRWRDDQILYTGRPVAVVPPST